MQKTRHRLATDAPLKSGALVALTTAQSHYLGNVLRLKAGDRLALFSRADGEWLADITEVTKKAMTVQVGQQLRAPAVPVDLWVAFAPIKGGRLETIIEKATELGAAELHPVITQRTIVDKVNIERAESIAREAAEQCERTDWPEIHGVQKLAHFLGSFPKDRLLVYGDETGAGEPIATLISSPRWGEVSAPALSGQFSTSFSENHHSTSPLRGEVGGTPGGGAAVQTTLSAAPPPRSSPLQGEEDANITKKWAILAGPEGGFTPEELAMLRHLPNARAVSLGPRILRADTAVITLAAITLSAWGDWNLAPRFQGANA